VIQSYKGVFLSYASEDADVAKRICDALCVAGIEVWFDQSELRGGDAWDQKIRQQIRDCALFVPIISAHTQARPEGYFRLEWKLAVDRSHLMAAEKAFLVPVVVDATTEPEALVPTQFRDVQWTRIQAGEVPAAFVDRIAALLNQPVTPPVGSPERGVSRTPARRLPIVLTALSVATVGALLIATAIRGGWLWHKPVPKVEAGSASAPVATTPAAIPEKSIAVLPFTDMSEKKDQEYFADGMAEEVLNLLTKIPGLTVIGRTSSFQFKGANQDLRVVGATLGAAYVVEGSVRRSLDRLRVTAQLIDTKNGAHRWSETYDRPVADTLQVQDEIAASLVRALEVAVGANRPQSRRRTQNAEAYDLYLRGSFARDRHDRDGVARAATYYQQALQLDPAFAEAAAGLAVAVYEQALSGYVSQSDGFSRARLAAQTAIKLDPALGMPHAVLGAIYAERDWNYDASERESKLALALAPHDGLVVTLASHLPQMLGQDDTARHMLEDALAYDPLFAPAYGYLASVEGHSGHWPEAEAAARRELQITPTAGHLLLGEILLLRGDKSAALAEFMREDDHLDRSVGLALVYHALNRKADADAALRTLTSEAGDQYAYSIAEVHAFRGEVDEALQWLDRLYSRRDSDLSSLKDDFFFKKLEADPRYKALLRKMNLPE
jgi:TolB-like protein/Tfp pilus assembly protein PilF